MSLQGFLRRIFSGRGLRDADHRLPALLASYHFQGVFNMAMSARGNELPKPDNLDKNLT
jgi:hypothetical protein